ncbi:hypothetical protein RMSM_05909 [Rhodopirellula maiorica SM1]|uniref:Uncharacterized protein n=1 Tax=Rhodopirellula maiorica SM1 TaxID=1265738 RepID=M5RT86_9BACT|nr:hypothetical protein RMSM_05909 [Rhodopirellula maiorica SM1]
MFSESVGKLSSAATKPAFASLFAVGAVRTRRSERHRKCQIFPCDTKLLAATKSPACLDAKAGG